MMLYNWLKKQNDEEIVWVYHTVFRQIQYGESLGVSKTDRQIMLNGDLYNFQI